MGSTLRMNGRHAAVLLATCCLAPSRVAWSDEVVQTLRWQDLSAAKALRSGTVIASGSGSEGPILRVAHPGPGAATFPLATIENPAITTSRYALRGRIRYEGVSAGSYLEMWNHLPDGAFFSRSLAENGPMGQLGGSSEWRSFVLPFFNRDGGPPPERLVVNLALTGGGIVEIGPLELVQFDAGEDPLADSSAWWNDRQAGRWGAIAGSALGILGAIIGSLGSTGRARGFVLGTLKAMALLGTGVAAAGAIAFFSGQPYGVYYPLVLVGTISAASGFFLPRSISRRYEELELRRMQALDA